MNKVELVGRMVKDPELKCIEDTDKKVCNFTIAVNRNFTNSNGEREADYIPIVVWGKTAENLCNYIKKGKLISVIGRLQIKRYESKDGTRRYISEVVGEEVSFLESIKEKAE